MKFNFCATIGLIASSVSIFMGGIDNSIIALAVFMATDCITGVLIAVLFHESPKTSTGLGSSKIFLRGLCRKIYMLLLCGLGNILDRVLGTAFIRDGIIYAFMSGEILSIIENAGLMGIPIPKVLERGLELLNGKEE